MSPSTCSEGEHVVWRGVVGRDEDEEEGGEGGK